MTEFFERTYTTRTALMSTRKAATLVGLKQVHPGRRSARPIKGTLYTWPKIKPQRAQIRRKIVIADCNSDDSAEKSSPKVSPP